MVEMLVVVLGPHATGEFASFMRRLAVPAELVDKLRDATLDFNAGELHIRPGWLFRARLLWDVVRRLPPLGACCLRRIGLAAWGARSLWIELRATPRAVAVTR